MAYIGGMTTPLTTLLLTSWQHPSRLYLPPDFPLPSREVCGYVFLASWNIIMHTQKTEAAKLPKEHIIIICTNQKKTSNPSHPDVPTKPPKKGKKHCSRTSVQQWLKRVVANPSWTPFPRSKNIRCWDRSILRGKASGLCLRTVYPGNPSRPLIHSMVFPKKHNTHMFQIYYELF